MPVQKVNLKVESGLDRIYYPALPADRALFNPVNASTCAFDGEWFVWAADGKSVVRAAAIGTLGTAGAGGRATTVRAFQLWAEKGRSDIQSMPECKAAFLYLGGYEAQTLIFDASADVNSGGLISAKVPGDPLKVATIAITTNGTTRNYCGLVGHGGAGDAAPIAAYISQLPEDNNGWLKYVKVS